jgi:hypothetical protein
VTIYYEATIVKIVNVERNHLPRESYYQLILCIAAPEGGSFQHLQSSHWSLHDKWSPFEILATVEIKPNLAVQPSHIRSM